MAVERPLGRIRFIRSSFCTAGGCIEVGQTADGGVAVRDSKDPDRPVLIFTADEWSDFLAGVRAGEFDRFGAPGRHPDGRTHAGRVAGS